MVNKSDEFKEVPIHRLAPKLLRDNRLTVTATIKNTITHRLGLSIDVIFPNHNDRSYGVGDALAMIAFFIGDKYYEGTLDLIRSLRMPILIYVEPGHLHLQQLPPYDTEGIEHQIFKTLPYKDFYIRFSGDDQDQY